MALHDAYARLTPFELAFPDRAEADRLFERIEEEAVGRHVAADQPHRFVMLASVGAAIRDLRGPEGPAEAVHEYGALAFHAYHFARAGGRVVLVSTDTARDLVQGSRTATAPCEPPAPGTAGYVQLPQHLFWTTASGSEAPQSIDGLFWTLAADGLLHVLLALAMLPDRGLAVVPLPEAPWKERAAWADADMREDGMDFTSSLPGAEMDGLHSFASAGEVLKLLVRVFARLERMGTLSDSASHPVGDPSGAAPTHQPSVLPFIRV